MNIIDENSFNFPVWELVASYLEDADLKNVSSTCMKAQQIAKNEFKKRSTELELLLSSYTCIKKFNVSHFKDAKKFCLGERHDLESHKESEKALIEHFAKRGPVLVVLETVPSLSRVVKEELKVINDDDHLIDLVAERLSDSHNIHYTGWDDVKSIIKLNNMKQTVRKQQIEKYKKIQSELKNKQGNVDGLMSHLNLICSELSELYANTSKVLNPQKFENPKLYVRYLNEVIDKETFLEEKDTIAKLIKLMGDHKRVKKNLHHAVQSYNESERERHKLFDRFEEERKITEVKMDKYLEKAYPIRTFSMAQTMANIDLYAQHLLLDNKVSMIFIAGNAHFAIKKERLGNPKYNLDPFYKEIINHKAAVFLPADVAYEFDF